jgi:integrase
MRAAKSFIKPENPTFGQVYQIVELRFPTSDKAGIQRMQAIIKAFGEDTPIGDINKLDVYQTIDKLPVTGSTKNRYASALSKLYRVASIASGYAGHNPAREIVKWKEGRGRKTYFTAAELNKLLEVARASSYPKLRLLILMGVVTGLRRGSLTRITHGDIDFEGKSILVRRTKNGTPFVAMMTDQVISEIAPFYRPDQPSQLLFAGRTGKPYILDKEYRLALKRAGLDKYEDACFHTLRHTTASLAAQSGASILQVMDLLNHKTPAMAARYAHLNTKSRETLVNNLFGNV